MTSSAQLEHEAEQTRAHIFADLDELRARITPGRLLDQAVDYAKENDFAEFTRNLRFQAVNNPMPVALIGAGMAWMALSSFRADSSMRAGSTRWNGKDEISRAGERFTEQDKSFSDGAGHTASDWTEGAQRIASEWAENAQQTADAWSDDLSENASSMGDQARARWHDARDEASGAASAAASRMQSAAQSASDGAAAASHAAADQARRAGQTMRSAASEARSKMASMGSNLSDSAGQLMGFLREHPLVLAGLGVVLGALLGAALPPTETENRVMGERSDDIKEGAASAAREQMQKGAAVAEAAWEGVKEEAQREGVPGFAHSHDGGASPDGADLVPSAGEGLLHQESGGS